MTDSTWKQDEQIVLGDVANPKWVGDNLHFIGLNQRPVMAPMGNQFDFALAMIQTLDLLKLDFDRKPLPAEIGAFLETEMLFAGTLINTAGLIQLLQKGGSPDPKTLNEFADEIVDSFIRLRSMSMQVNNQANERQLMLAGMFSNN